jgi:hypothetical protein
MQILKIKEQIKVIILAIAAEEDLCYSLHDSVQDLNVLLFCLVSKLRKLQRPLTFSDIRIGVSFLIIPLCGRYPKKLKIS